MRLHNAAKDDEASDAAWEAGRGGLYGAAKWGVATAVLGGLGYAMSPVYRGLTIQFKIYLQMSGMVLGGMVEADRSLRSYEARMRAQKRVMREQQKWQRFTEEYGKDEDDE